MGSVMTPDMIYQYPTWAIGLLVISAAIVGSVLLELCARRLLPLELRRGHNDVAAAIFSIIGVTYAVLLAFVAMLAWEGFNKAKAASYAEVSVSRRPPSRTRCRAWRQMRHGNRREGRRR